MIRNLIVNLIGKIFKYKKAKVQLEEEKTLFFLRDLDKGTYEKISENTFAFLITTSLVVRKECEYEDKYKHLFPKKVITITISRWK